MDVKLNDIVKICDGRLVFGDGEIVCENFSKDTRTIGEGDIYVGIKGESFDGNALYEEAFEKGAKVCILQGVEVSESVRLKFSDRAVVIVDDSIKALQEIAAYKRSLYDIPVVAVTGSVGKTSTKDIIASVVSMGYKVLKTQGNLNNHIGLPLTILGLKDHEALIVEMGMNNLGEISVLSKIAKPNVAVITNVGTSHIGNLGSRENILKAKLEILDGLKNDGVLIINNDNDMLNKWYSNCCDGINGFICENGKNVRVYTYGIESESNVMASNIESNENSSEFDVKGESFSEKIMVPVGGNHFVYNALSAILVGKCLNIPILKIKEGIKSFELTKSRMEIVKLEDDINIVNDCYNANYDSMKAAIEYIAKTSANRKVAVLGDMLELGEFSEDLHIKVGKEIIKNNINILVTVGTMGKVISETAKESGVEIYHCNNNEEAVKVVKTIMQKGDIILVKASNGMKFKEIVEGLIK